MAQNPLINSIDSKIQNRKSQLNEFETEPNKKVNNRILELEAAIDSINEREPKDPENRSMHSHLVKLKEGLEQDPDAWVSYRIKEIESEIQDLEVRLDETKAEIENSDIDMSKIV